VTATVTTLTVATVTASGPFGAAPTALGIVVAALLAVVLVEKELLRAFGGASAREALRTLDIAIAPLLFVFAVTVAIRLARLLGIV